MNKKVLMLAPFMGLLLTACGGPNWKEITFQDATTKRNEIESAFSEFPKTAKIYYEGNKATIFGQKFENIPFTLSYDIDKKFMSISSLNTNFATQEMTFQTSYYVTKDNKLWDLSYNSYGQKTKQELEIEAFGDVMSLHVKPMVFDTFYLYQDGTDSLANYVSMIETVKSFADDKDSIQYKFYTHGDNSLKFSYTIKNATFKNMSSDDTKFNGSEEYVIENGLMSYKKANGNTILDISASTMLETPTQTNQTIRFSYNCGGITIPEEANPDTWLNS